MNFVTLKDLLPLVPEIIILFTSFIVILVDLFAPKKNRMTTLAVTSLVGIGLALFAEFQLYGSNPTGFYGTVVSDPYSILFESLYLIVAGVTVFISLHYIAEQEMNYGEYYVLLLSALMGMMVMTSSLEMLVIFIGLEIMSISSYILVGMKRRVALSNEAALKYLLLGAFSTGFLLYGISLLYGATGTTYLPGIIESLQQGPFFSNPLAVAGVGLVIISMSFKIAIVPFHMWTPDVYQGAPTSVTSFFSVVPKIAGIAVFIRFMYVPFNEIINQWQFILIFISIASMILGAVAAIGQGNIKRLFAYSSIGHIGYAIAGIAAGTENGLKSTLIYITIYSIMNIGAFGFIFLMKRGTKYIEEIDELAGLSKNHPMMSLSLLVILFSLAGIPPLAGFFAKFYIFMSVIESGMYTLAIIGLVTTVVSAFYYIRIVKIMYFDDPRKPFENDKEYGIYTSMAISCLLLITFFLYPSIFSEILSNISIY